MSKYIRVVICFNTLLFATHIAEAQYARKAQLNKERSVLSIAGTIEQEDLNYPVIEPLRKTDYRGARWHFWDFENGWQGWSHTNGLNFPQAWDVQRSDWRPSYTPPDAGDSTMWIDSDAAGVVLLTDTAYSPAVTVPGPALCRWGIGFLWYDGGNAEWVAIGVRPFTAGVWQTPVELRRYEGASFGPDWDSVSISAFQDADSIKVFFAYNNAYYDWYVGFDNVSLYAASDLDVGVVSIDVPPVLPENTTLAPAATIGNFGGSSATFNVTCEITPGSYIATTTVNDLAAGSYLSVTFPETFTFASGDYPVKVYTQLAGDENPPNDTLAKIIAARSWLAYDDGLVYAAWGYNDPGNGWGNQFPAGVDLWVDSIACHIYDASWPVPGGNTATFRIYDGATPTDLRWQLFGTTVVRGDWNKFAVDTTLTWFPAGDNVFLFYIQDVAYPDCPGLSLDAYSDYPQYSWEYDMAAFNLNDQGGDWLLRIHVVTSTGISEWRPQPAEGVLLRAPAITRGGIDLAFTLPRSTTVDLAVYDALGRKRALLISEQLPAGDHQRSFGLNLAGGVYFCRLRTGSGANVVHKFLFLR